MRWSIPSLLLALACTGDEPETGIEETGETGLLACSPSLVLTLSSPAILPLSQAFSQPYGGTGQYQFALLDDDSTALLNPTTGAYLAGPDEGAEDTLILTDSGCIGEASATLLTVGEFEVEPQSATLLPHTTFTISVTGGSGEYSCSVDIDQSGAQLDGCTYTAGGGLGRDQLLIRDEQTGLEQWVTYVVDPDADLSIDAAVVFVPVGAPYDPQTTGGSGVLEMTVLSGDAVLADSVLTAGSAGTSEVQVVDVYTGFSAQFSLIAAEPWIPDTPRDGEGTSRAIVLGPGDITGNGYPDALLSVEEASLLNHFGGMVSLYEGTATGLSPEPVQSWGHDAYKSYYGQAITTGDFDADGLLDLAVGASAESDVENNAGAVFVYLGQSTGGFSESVDIRLDSAYSSDRLGFSLASCDLNGDGYDDLIAGAYGAEDRSVDEVENGQGGLFLYLGNPAGLSETPSGYRWGVLLDETDTWKYADVGIGRTIGAADLNGDGLCDVIIGNELHNWGRDSEDGTQMVYFGSATQADGLDTLPGRVFEMGADHGKGRLGEKMAFGDFDGDGADDVALGARLATNDNDDTYPGMVLVFLAQSMEGIPATQALTPDDADWVVIGDNSYDYVGRGLNVADVTGDGLADLLVSAPYGESDESENNVGLVSVYSGEAIAEMSDASASPYDASTDPPVLQWVGAIKSASLGIGLDAIGDLDGDGLSDLLAHATCDPTYGSCGGAPYWLKTTDLSLHLLDFAHKTAGHGYGEAGTLLFYDVDADGLDDLLVGGPGVGEFDTQPNVGVVLAYAGQSDALSNAAVTLPLTHPQVSTNSTMGHHLSSAGDFNQDGWADLVVVSKDESKPSSFGSDYINPDECASGSLYSAGAAAIHLGSSAGISEEPAFLVFGPLESDDIRTVIGDLDLNGDGWDDVVIGSDLWASSAGGVGVLYGQAENSSGITILCDPLLLYGEDTSIEVGRALASLGDIDGDGCDDVAIGVAEDDLLDNDEGSVRILWGWGGAGCPATPELSGFTLDANEAEIGAALASGWDADKDGVNDLWVGAPGYNGSGAVWRISGATLTGLARSPVAGGILSSEAVTVFESDSLAGVERLDGSTLNSRFGESIAVLPDRGLLAIGSPMGDLGGLSGSGGVELFRFAADTSTWSTAAIVAGETHQPGGRLGTSIVAKDLIHSHLLVVGAPEIDGNGVDHGGVYVFELPTGL